MTDEVIDHDARADLKGHMDVCTERYGNLWSAIKDLKESTNADRIARTAVDTLTHQRFNTISNRMFTMLCGVTGASIAGLCAVVFKVMFK